MQLLFAFVSRGSVVRCWTVAGVIGHLFQLLLGGHVLRSLCWKRIGTLAWLAVLLRLEWHEATMSERGLRCYFIVAQAWLSYNLLHVRAFHLRLELRCVAQGHCFLGRIVQVS